MTTPSKEVYTNVASCVASGSSGTTTTDTSWTMGTGSSSFPAASTSVVPNTYFYVTDPADTTHEIVKVVTASGTSWTVERGALGTTAVAHATGATWVQTITHGSLQNFKQAPSASTTPVTVATTTETLVASYQPTTDEIVPGAAWDLVSYGALVTNNATAANRQVQWTIRWGGITGTILCMIKTNTNCTGLATTVGAGKGGYDLNGTVTLIDSTHASTNMNFYCNGASLTAVNVTATATNDQTGGGSTEASVAITGSGPLVLTAKWVTGTITNQTLTATAPLIYRAA